MNELSQQIIDILKALLTPTLALVAAYIAYQQYKLAKTKQDIDIHDRRLNIYKKTIRFLRKIENYQDITEIEYNKWELMQFEAGFLFDEVVTDHLNTINELVSELLFINQEINKHNEVEFYNEKPLNQVRAEKFLELISLVGITITVFSSYFQIIKKRHRIVRHASYEQIVKSENEKCNNLLANVAKDSICGDYVPF